MILFKLILYYVCVICLHFDELKSKNSSLFTCLDFELPSTIIQVLEPAVWYRVNSWYNVQKELYVEIVVTDGNCLFWSFPVVTFKIIQNDVQLCIDAKDVYKMYMGKGGGDYGGNVEIIAVNIYSVSVGHITVPSSVIFGWSVAERNWRKREVQYFWQSSFL